MSWKTFLKDCKDRHAFLEEKYGDKYFVASCEHDVPSRLLSMYVSENDWQDFIRASRVNKEIREILDIHTGRTLLKAGWRGWCLGLNIMVANVPDYYKERRYMICA